MLWPALDLQVLPRDHLSTRNFFALGNSGLIVIVYASLGTMLPFV